MKLLRYIIPKYEDAVKNMVHVPLSENQFDALVCFAFNVGSVESKIATAIDTGDIPAAMAQMKTHNTSGGVVVSDLVIRRDDEVNLFLHGYDCGAFHKPI